MKRRIRQNIWGNWKGYEGTRRVEDFGTDEQEARLWLANSPLANANLPRGPIRLRSFSEGQAEKPAQNPAVSR